MQMEKCSCIKKFKDCRNISQVSYTSTGFHLCLFNISKVFVVMTNKNTLGSSRVKENLIFGVPEKVIIILFYFSSVGKKI